MKPPRNRCLKERVTAAGVVKWCNANKSFGSIEPEVGRPDVLVHIGAISGRGDRLQFQK